MSTSLVTSADYTPVQQHRSPTSSTTPTRHVPNPGRQPHPQAQPQGQAQPQNHPPPPAPLQADFTSPSAYLNNDAYAHSEPNTPHGGASFHEMTYLMTGGSTVSTSGSASTSGPSSSHSTSSSHPLHTPAQMDGHYGFAYGDFSSYPSQDSHDLQHGHDQSTPSASNRTDDDSTPVIPDNQAPIPASSLPDPHATIRAPSQHKQAPLMSPFRPMTAQSDGEGGMAAYQPPPAFIDPSTAFYPNHHPNPHQHQHQHQHPQQPYAYPHSAPPAHMQQHPYPQTQYIYHNGSPHEGSQPTFMMPMNISVAPQYVNMQAHVGQVFVPPGQTYLPAHMGQTYDYGPPRSRNGSPTSSISSSVPSLARSASTSSELRPVRPKVKLTFEDKRNIVELHRSNSSLRQEDIARQYGVDRSTISKIILSAHRWTQPQEPLVPAAPKQLKTVGGRFPAIEEKMHEWMDQQIAAGLDVRDNIARDKAKAFAREIGFPMERFKASAKWLDKFKDRRKAAGKPTTSPMHIGFGYYPYTTGPYTGVSPMNGAMMLSRSQSAMTLSSSDSSSQEVYQPSPDPGALQAPNPMGLTKSESDLVHVETTPSSRQRSQSSPHTLGLAVDPGMLSPSSGKATRFSRPSPLTLTRQDSFHGTSPSPRRPTPLTRANSVQGSSSLRRSRPGSLAASAFGITPLNGDEAYSPLNSPSTAGSGSSAGTGTHSRQRSDVSLAPFTTSMSGMTISPDMSDSSESSAVVPLQIAIPPLTPITPATATASGHPHAQGHSHMQPQVHVQGVFANTDYGDMGMAAGFNPDPSGHLGMGMGMGGPGHGHYATMPNKHYGHAVAYAEAYQSADGVGGDFGPSPTPPTSAGVYRATPDGHGQQWS